MIRVQESAKYMRLRSRSNAIELLTPIPSRTASLLPSGDTHHNRASLGWSPARTEPTQKRPHGSTLPSLSRLFGRSASRLSNGSIEAAPFAGSKRPLLPPKLRINPPLRHSPSEPTYVSNVHERYCFVVGAYACSR